MERRSVMYKRIRVATGGSPWSDAAVAYAIRLAVGMGTEVVIVTVLAISLLYGISGAGIECDMVIDSVEQEGKERLLKAAPYATWVGVASSTLLTCGCALPMASATTAWHS